MRPKRTPLLAFALACSLSACDRQPSAERATGAATESATRAGPMRVTVVARGLEHPWAVAPLPEGGFLVTERPGRLRRVGPNGSLSAPLAGVPPVFAEGQGGLLDVVLDPDFVRNRRIWLSYAEPGPDGTAGTAVGHGTLGEGGISGFRRIYQQQPKLEGPNHFGSRIAFDHAGHVYISQGERNDRPAAQKLDMLQGKLVRLRLDGSVPPDNPFVGRPGARPEIWSSGHRNSQSLAVDPRTGRLWEAEHGPRGGDEINLPLPGRNYGWPVATHGINYSGLRIPEATGETAPGIEPPHHVWERSPALSGMAFYTGRATSKWNDSLFLGALAGRALIRLSLDGDRITGEERLLEDREERIRDVRVGADGALYVLTDERDGSLLRIEPPR
jgi:glucose/arabinose dehydrogenase